MDWIIGVICLIVGTGIGYFVAKYVNLSTSETQQKLSEQEIKQLLSQQAQSYLGQSRQGLNNLQKQVQQLQAELNGYEALLSYDAGAEEKSGINYFDEQAATYLRNKQASQKREKMKTETQPLDFSGESSGLFDGSKSQQVLENKS